MKILIAEDDKTSRLMLEAALRSWGHDVMSASNGDEAWTLLQAQGRPPLAILDWMMPGMDGIQICGKLRGTEAKNPVYVILLTALDRKEDIVAGLSGGADDYVTKPFDTAELRARVQVGQRIVELREALESQVRELETALAHIKTLQGILPICMHCRKIRDDQESWLKLERYVEKHAGVQFSHGLCAECLEKYYPEI